MSKPPPQWVGPNTALHRPHSGQAAAGNACQVSIRAGGRLSEASAMQHSPQVRVTSVLIVTLLASTAA
ncbi:MAG: hypothetical protein GY807_06460, partial [Gammaproteobacteria bacterium]|nr:hypothetical protein [Gammaproteobacteria bacterium]